MNTLRTASVLLVSESRRASSRSEAAISFAKTGQSAIGFLAITSVDLVVIDSRLPDMSPWDLVAKLRLAWPWQKWALVGMELTDADEARARELGVTGVFDGHPTEAMLGELANSLRRRTSPMQELIPTPTRARRAGLKKELA